MYTKHKAIRLIRENLVNGAIVPTVHFKKRMTDRKISMQDVIAALKNDAIYDEPELDIKINQWKYRVEGKTTDDEPLVVVVGLDGPRNILITCIRG